EGRGTWSGPRPRSRLQPGADGRRRSAKDSVGDARAHAPAVAARRDGRVTEISDVELSVRDGISVARVRGEIDLSNADSIFSTLSRAGAPTTAGLVVDLSGVDYLDSAGVQLLFRLARALGESDRTLRTVVPGDARIRRGLELANVGGQVGVDESEDAALAHVRGL